ncbi:hypothetical protein JTE90_005072 [Oedothorax gibbosus]|uniref:Uncharacterized protein n=1 Tax=Oedothorax gibbosus TaxID=931172 RepID=A0AAV6VCR1_9ARAC|nr:hypothetical protein JTE90_005072 [Oedothorax gibbosus]
MGEEISRSVAEESKNHEKCIAKETAVKKENESNGDASGAEIEVISKPECQAGEPMVDSELEMAGIKKSVPDKIQKQNDVERIEEKESTGSVSGRRQNEDTLNAAFIDEENASENVESDDESLSDEDEILSYNTTTQELTGGKIAENVLQVLEERSLHKEKESVSQSTQISGGLVDEDSEADSRATAIKNDETIIQDSDEVASRNGVADAVVEEENELSSRSKMPEVHNVATSTEDSTDVKGKIEDKGPNVPRDEGNKDSSTLPKMTKVQNAATSTEVTVDEGLSPNGKKLAAKQIPTSSKEVAEIISKYLNSKENMEKLDKIDDIVKRLRKQSSEEFPSSERSTEDLSPEDLKTLKEHYSQQLQKLATKRKSKICDLDEDPEDMHSIPKKCKLSNAFDIPFEMENWETSCCLEEQFRIAFKETNDGKEKEYKFPLSSGNEQPRKFCKHQIAKIDAMVASVMSLDSYMSNLPDETDNPNNSTEEVYEDTPCCYHTKEQSSSSARKSKDEVLSGPQESAPEKRIADSNVCSEASDKTKWLSYFTFEGALKSIKNFTLFVSFTGSLMVAMTAGRLFGVDFPVSKSKRNTTRDNSLQEFPTL